MGSKKKIFAFIFARGGSKRIKNKNLKKKKGKTLVERTIIFAKKTRLFDKIFLSSDSKKILYFGKKNNINLIKRPKKLSQDKSAEPKAWSHAIKQAYQISKFDTMVVLPCTSPFTTKKDVTRCIQTLRIDNADLVTTISESERNTDFNMVKKDKKNLIKILINKKNFKTRDKLPKVYNLANSVYVTKPNYVLKNSFIYTGKVKGVVVPTERFLDIDTQADLKVAKALIHQI